MTENPASISHGNLQHLLAVDIAAMPDGQALDHAGSLIDASCHARSSTGFDRVFELLGDIQGRTLSSDLAALVHYFRANAWAGREQIRVQHDVWAWEQPEHQEQILALRSAVRHEGFNQIPNVRRCQILTNLASALNNIGRFVDAVEIWDRALRADATFGMARGNLGIGLLYYAGALYDRGQAAFMRIAAHDALEAASAADAFYESDGYESPRADFEKQRQDIAALGDITATREHFSSHRFSLGKSAGEKRYRTWCLANRLFINPLNDLGALPIAGRDVLTLPNITVPMAAAMADPPAIVGFFNQMKQEFVSARYLYYEGVHAGRVHFSDRGVQLYNTLDYPSYSLASEKIRMAFRMAYSLFDKIGFFINDYFALGIKPDRVSFRGLWYETKGSPPRPLLQRFTTYPNWPLRGLFWLSKDLFDDAFKSATEPEAAELSEIRNHLEHKYLQLHLESLDSSGPAGVSEALRYSLTTDEFAARTLRLLKLARAALTYLSLAVHWEEKLRAQERQDKRAFELPLDTWPDEWKR